MITNQRGQIIADYGIRWCRYHTEQLWWSVDPYGYRIDYLVGSWRLYRPASKFYIADQTIFYGRTYLDCMRAAEIYDVSRKV